MVAPGTILSVVEVDPGDRAVGRMAMRTSMKKRVFARSPLTATAERHLVVPHRQEAGLHRDVGYRLHQVAYVGVTRTVLRGAGRRRRKDAPRRDPHSAAVDARSSLRRSQSATAWLLRRSENAAQPATTPLALLLGGAMLCELADCPVGQVSCAARRAALEGGRRIRYACTLHGFSQGLAPTVN